MSQQRISQKSCCNSDFSIARILSNDLSPYLQKEIESCHEFNINKNEFKDEREIFVNNRKEYEFKKMPRLQEDGSVNFNSINSSQLNLKEDEKQILGRELAWLRCTRYSPPKLPRRRPGSEKQTKRRLGSHPRIPFTKLQIQVLEEKYRSSAYLSRKDVIHLAEICNLPQNRVKIWFQNRRAREKRESLSQSK